MPPITLALFLQRFRSVVLDVQISHSSPGAVDQAGDVPALGRWVQTDQYCKPIPGSPPWVLALVTRSFSPGAVDRAGDVPVLGRWVQTDQYCNPILGSPPWVLALVTRSLLSCGRWLLRTGAILKARSTDRWCLWLLGRSVVEPKLLDAGLSFVSQALLSFTNLK